MKNSLITTSQDTKLALSKVSSIFSLRNKLIHSKYTPPYFELPLITNLTEEHYMAIDSEQVISLFSEEGLNIAIFRHVINCNIGKNSKLVTYSKVLSKYLFELIKQVDFEASKRIYTIKECLLAKNRPFCDNVDEIIIYGAEEITYKELKIFQSFDVNISIIANFNQKVSNYLITKKEIKNLLPNNEEYYSNEIFYNTKEIIDFTKALFPTFKIYTDSERGGRKPLLLIGYNQQQKILEIIENFSSSLSSILILLPFAKDVDDIFNTLKEKVNCSYYYNKLSGDFNISNIHITTFESSKDFLYDYVIIPDFQNFNSNIKCKNNITENDYYLAFRKARTTLFLLSSKKLNIDSETCNIQYF